MWTPRRQSYVALGDEPSEFDFGGWLQKKGTVYNDENFLTKSFKWQWRRRFVIVRSSSIEWHEKEPQSLANGTTPSNWLKLTMQSTVRREHEAQQRLPIFVVSVVSGAGRS